jgi:hypothetical protein
MDDPDADGEYYKRGMQIRCHPGYGKDLWEFDLFLLSSYVNDPEKREGLEEEFPAIPDPG